MEEKTMRFPSAYNKTREWIMRIAENPETEVEKLPAERQICTILDVSRDTVRRVIAALVEEGILEVRHGNGTYINAAALKRHKKQLNPPVLRSASYSTAATPPFRWRHTSGEFFKA